jgi:hypothetical protein
MSILTESRQSQNKINEIECIFLPSNYPVEMDYVIRSKIKTPDITLTK